MTKWNSVKIPKAATPFTLTDLFYGKSYFFGLSAVSGAGEGEILVGREYTDAKEALRLRPGEKRHDDLLYAISSGAKN